MEPEVTHRGRAGFKNKLKEACRIMNTSVHGATKVKPFNLIYNYGDKDGQVLENVSDERIKASINNAINESPEKRVIYRKLKNSKGGNELATIMDVENVTDVMVKPMNEKDSRKTISLSGYKNRLYSQEKGRS
uniref:PB1 domain-containing protein n=1 Tax=Strongyloides venezuelensis TaxID=75913 RepID=A0A0K0F012_STRVS